MTRTNRKTSKTIADEFLRDEVEDLIRQGRISKAGIWYRINDMEVLNNDLAGFIKRLSVNKQELLVQLYS